MTLPTVEKGGTWLRVGGPDWNDPMDASFSMARGGRWNAPGSFPMLYLHRNHEGARTYVLHKLEGQPYQVEDLDESQASLLIAVEVPASTYADALSDEGLTGCGLPASYPTYTDGSPVPWEACQPVGQAAFDEDLDGVASRSVSVNASRSDEELGHIPRLGRPELRGSEPQSFAEWFWRDAQPETGYEGAAEGEAAADDAPAN